MPTLHLRNVPEEIYEGLRERARARGTSMNAEAVAILRDVVATNRRTWDEVMASIEANAKEIGFGPHWTPPEDIVRADRDSDHGRS